jgi:hypothetical protein
MTNLTDLKAAEIKEILTQKKINFEYLIGDFDYINIGIKAKSIYSWLRFDDKGRLVGGQMYSSCTGKTSAGWSSRLKVYDKFLKLIN